MSVSAGSRLGPYEILAPLGTGGMGEVWKARDPRLARDVAIKILPATVSTDADRLRRFEQEARAAAALSHSHILAVYDVGSHDERPYIVSELLEGETLRARLESGPLPARKAIDYAVQIAHGLAAAHDRGIVHRDLKPENLFVDSTGHVKILDFGLAKLTEREPALAGVSALPTQAPETHPGLVLGTMGYMSPEQVRGQTADHRADIFALGTVLYEMLSGQRAFRRDTAIDTMTAILKEDPPDLPVVDKRIPPALVRIVDRCLEKSAARRFQSADDLAFALEALTTPSGAAKTLTDDTVTRRHGSQVPWLVAAVLGTVAVAAAALAAMLFVNRAPGDTRTLRYSIPPPDGWRLSLETRPGAPTPIVLAPDGRSMAFVVRRSGREDQVWIQPLDALTPHALAGTEGASSVFWSPDSRYLGFFAKGNRLKIEVGGGPPTTLCDAPGAAGGTWSRDGVIVFNGGVTSLKKVSAAGGPVTDATKIRDGERAHFRPWLLPDGRHVVYVVLGRGSSTTRMPIFVGSLDSDQRVQIGESSATNVAYSQGHLLFVRDSTLMAQPLDPERIVTTGDAFPITEDVQSQGAEPHQAVFSVSQNGVLAFQKRYAGAASQLTWVDRTGKALAAVGDKVEYSEIVLSPDEHHAVVSLALSDLWVVDLGRGLRTRFTFDQQVHLSPTWSPDGQRVAFAGPAGSFVKPANGADTEEPLFHSGPTRIPSDWSADGRYMIGMVLPAGRVDSDLEVWSTSDTSKSVPVLSTRFNETIGRFSPDTRWLAYVSDESGRNEVYVAALDWSKNPESKLVVTRGKWQISTSGGTMPRWRRDGKEIVYFDDANSRLMAVTVDTKGDAVAIGTTQTLFSIRPSSLAVVGPLQRSFYGMSRDGQRFLVNAEPDTQSTSPPTTVVVNWLPPSKHP